MDSIPTLNHFNTLNLTTKNNVVQQQGNNVPNQLSVDLALFRSNNTKNYQNIAILNSQGNVSVFTVVPMLMIDPYSKGINQQRTVWIAVNNNKGESVDANNNTVYRNNAGQMMELFLTPALNKISNPYNSLIIQKGHVREMLLQNIHDEENIMNKMFKIFMQGVDKLKEIHKNNEDELKEEIAKLYKKYQSSQESAYNKGHLHVSQVIICETILPVFAMNPSMQASTNPWLNFKTLGEKFGFSHCPSINHVSGHVTTTKQQAPVSTGLELGRISVDKGENKRYMTSVMGTAKDTYGNPTEILLSVVDLPYTSNRQNSRTRSEVFEGVTEQPTHMFVSGALKVYIASQGTNSLQNGFNMMGVQIEQYTQHQMNSNNMDLTANSIESMSLEDFDSILNSVVSSEEVMEAKESTDTTVDTDTYHTPF